MTSVQIIGLTVASLALLLLVVALIVTRRRPQPQADEPAPTDRSFLDSAPHDTFAGLGAPEQPIEDVTMDPLVPPADAPGLMWTTPHDNLSAPAGRPSADADGADEVTGDLRDDVTGELRTDDTLELPPADSAATAAAAADGDTAAPDAGGTADATRTAAGSAPASVANGRGRLVPLSSILVTTSDKMVNLDDPEVRRMLTELVTYEIEQAAQFRSRGQVIDALLQLTEAEKVSEALGMTESAARIQAMMSDIEMAD
jgi:hypothetical protein